jgi:mRNA interferase RelE/StbE
MRVEFSQTAEKQLKKLDVSVTNKIKKWKRKIESLDNPRAQGKALVENLKGLWRYRVGDYRIVCDIQDDRLIVLVLKIGHRSEVYD